MTTPFDHLLDDDDRHRLLLLQRDLLKFNGTPASQLSVSDTLLFMTCARIDHDLGKQARLAFLTWAFRSPDYESPAALEYGPIVDDPVTSSKDLHKFESMGLLVWAAPQKPVGALSSDPWKYSEQFYFDLRLLAVAFTGQRSLVIPLSRRRPERVVDHEAV